MYFHRNTQGNTNQTFLEKAEGITRYSCLHNLIETENRSHAKSYVPEAGMPFKQDF